MKKQTWIIVGCVFVIAFILFTGAYFHATGVFGFPSIAADTEEVKGIRSSLGAMGDYFGGLLNPVIGLVSTILLLITVRETVESNRLAREAIKQNAEEMKMARESLKDDRESLKASIKAQNQSLELNEKQANVSMFYEMYELLSNHIKENKDEISKETTNIINFLDLDNTENFETVSKIFTANHFLKSSISQFIYLYDISKSNESLNNILCDLLDKELIILLSILSYIENTENNRNTFKKIRKIMIEEKFLKDRAICLDIFGGKTQQVERKIENLKFKKFIHYTLEAKLVVKTTIS